MKGLFFQYPAFLFGLTALAIPIILHLINRNVPKRIVFPSIRFIQKAQHLKTGKKYIRDWWVLLSRLIILTMIILLFASPMIAVDDIILEESAEEIVLFYDLSISMNFNFFNKFVLDQTKKILKEHKKARFALIASSNKIEKKISFGSQTSEIIRYVEQLQPTLIVGNHQEGLLAVEKLFTRGNKVKKTLYVFSDIQRQDWATLRLPSLNLNAEVKFIKPSQSDSSNLAISQVFPEIYVKDDIRRLRTTIDVHNYSLKPARVKLQLTAGDAVESRTVELRGDYSEKFVMDLKNPQTNIAKAELVVDEEFVLDDSYFFWIGPKAPIKIGAMADVRSTQGKSTEIFFLHNALSVSFPGAEAYDTSVIGPDFIWSSSLTEFQCVFVLDELSDYTEAEMDIFQDYIIQGGTLVYFSGNETAANIAKLNQSNLSKVRFLGYQGEINQLRSYSVTTIHDRSPIVSLFEKERGDLFQFPIYKFAKISRSPDSRVLLIMENNYPFLIEEQAGKGNLFIFAISLAPAWSEFPTSLSFLPLIHRIVETSAKGKKRGILEVTIGDNYTEKFINAGLPEDYQLPLEPGVQLVQSVPVEINITRWNPISVVLRNTR